MDADEDSITLSMDEYASLQTDLLSIKHENARLKEISEKHEEVCKSLKEIQQDLPRLHQIESAQKNLAKFSRDVLMDCLKSVRKQEKFDTDQSLLIEQVLGIVEHMWPKGGEGEIVVLDIQELVVQNEIKAFKDMNEKLNNDLGSLEDMNKKLKNDLEVFEEKCKTITVSINEKEKESMEKDKKIEELEGDKDQINSKLASMEKEIVELQRSTEKMAFDLASKKEEILELEKQKEQRRCDLGSSKKEILQLEKQKEQISCALALREEEILELEKQKDRISCDLSSKDEEIADAQKQLKEMISLENSKQEVLNQLEAVNKELETMKKDFESLSVFLGDVEGVKKLQRDFEELKNSENLLNLEYSNLKNSAKQTFSELTASKTHIKELESKLKKSEETLKKTHLEFEDMKTERQIIQKRSMNDLKDLKAELAKEKSLHELCKMDKEKTIQENRKLQENLRAGAKLPAPSHQEKVLVESMANRLGQLEKENLGLKHKIREIECFAVENQRLSKENDELRVEITKLSEDMAMMGARFNEFMRNSKTQ